jgi:hypothetical protein
MCLAWKDDAINLINYAHVATSVHTPRGLRYRDLRSVAIIVGAPGLTTVETVFSPSSG